MMLLKEGIPVRNFSDADELIRGFLSNETVILACVAYGMPAEVVIGFLRAFLSSITLSDTKDAHKLLKDIQAIMAPTVGGIN